jgi:AraC family transcriptional regulator of adaptative response/methylated-DNA-[protein]-cysteine methyltransferase
MFPRECIEVVMRRLQEANPTSRMEMKAKALALCDLPNEAGFNSNSRFYAKSSQALGMTPTNFRNGGTGTTIRFAVAECSLGSVLVAASEKGVCAIFLGNDPNALAKDLQDKFPKAHMIGGDEKFERTVAQVIGFIEAPKIGLDLPLDVRGTAFQQKVWRALREIPVGSTVSYTDIAERIGAPKAVRAVARACASNAIAVAIPCHRAMTAVFRATGGALSARVRC